LQLEKEIEVKNEKLLLYSATTDKLRISEITKLFFSVFTNKNGNQPDWSILYSVCLSEIIIIKKEGAAETVYNLSSFIEPRKKILTDGTLTGFEEYELKEETHIIGSIAQRHSYYGKRGALSGKSFEQKGNKFFQFVKTAAGWKISSVIWEDEAHSIS
jgi:hypothetical protein